MGLYSTHRLWKPFILQAWLAYELMKENGVQADVTLLHVVCGEFFEVKILAQQEGAPVFGIPK